MSISQELMRATQAYGNETHLIPDKPIPSRRTPRGPDEGCSTTSLGLQALLDQKAEAAAHHTWWEENPGVFADL